MLVAVALVLAGCGSGSSPSMLDPKGSEAHDIAGLWWLMFAIASGVYLVVAGFIVHAIVRRPGAKAVGDLDDSTIATPRRFDDRMIVFGGVVVPVLILIFLGFVTVHTTNALRRPEPNALRIDVEGHRWWWSVTYPDTGFTTADELRLPAGRPVEIRLTTQDVIHSFWVPQLAGKVDTIPGQDQRPAVHRSHAGRLQGSVRGVLRHRSTRTWGSSCASESAGDFDRWLAQHSRPPLEPASEAAAEGQTAFNAQPCAGCHTIDGTPAQGTVGPNLTDVGERLTIGAGALTNTPSNLARWIKDAPGVKPGVLMPTLTLSSRDVNAIVTYLESLK